MIHIQKLQDFLGISSEDDTAKAFELMENQLAYVSRLTQRYFGELQLMPVERFRGGQPVWLTEIPTVDDDHEFLVESGSGADWTEIAADEYELDGYEVRHYTGWPEVLRGYTQKNVRVTYYAGYEIGGLPGDIEQLVLELTARAWQDRGRESLKSERIGDSYAYTLADRGDGDGGGLTRQQEDTIRMWKHPALGVR